MIAKLITAAVLITATVAPAFAWVDGREANQQARIMQGVANGSLSPGELYNLERREASIRHEENVMRAFNGGALTPYDRFVLNQRLDRTSGAIWRDKHD
jgi:hypothetical protein